MGIWEIIGGALLLIANIAIIVSVMFQEQKGNGVNALGGGSSDSYIDKNRTMTNEATLSLITKYSGVAVIVLTLIVLAVSIYVK